MTIKNLLPKFPKLKYVSIGDGDERKNLEKLKKELKLDNNVKLIFSVEGFGITYIEAASYGTPSIGGIYGGEGDAIKSGQTGYLCNGNDLNALYDTLSKILVNDHYKELGTNALNFSKNFSWNIIVKKYIELI